MININGKYKLYKTVITNVASTILPFRRSLIFLFFSTLLSSLLDSFSLTLFFPVLLQFILPNSLDNSSLFSFESLNYLGPILDSLNPTFLLFIFISTSLLKLLLDIVVVISSSRLVVSARNTWYELILSSSLSHISGNTYHQVDIGDITETLASHTQKASNALNTATLYLKNIFTFLSFLVSLLIISFTLSATLIFLFLLLFIFLKYFRVYPSSADTACLVDINRTLNVRSTDLLLNSKLIILNNAQSLYLSRISRLFNEYIKQSVLYQLKSYLPSSFFNFLFLLLLVCLAIFSNSSLLSAYINIPLLGTYFLLTYRFFDSATTLSSKFYKLLLGLSHIYYISKCLKRFNSNSSLEYTTSVSPFVSSIHSENLLNLSAVSIHNPSSPDHLILNDFSRLFTPGLYHLKGKSGSGKSTVLDVLSGFRRPDSGSILINNCSIISHDIYRLGLIEYATQKPNLLQSSIRDNLLLGRSNISDDMLYFYLDLLHLSDFIRSLPDSLDHHIGPTSQLSGGQAQRLALCRVFLSSAPLILLDEPTSAVEPFLRESIQNALRLHLSDRIIIQTSHDDIPHINPSNIWNLSPLSLS